MMGFRKDRQRIHAHCSLFSKASRILVIIGVRFRWSFRNLWSCGFGHVWIESMFVVRIFTHSAFFLCVDGTTFHYGCAPCTPYEKQVGFYSNGDFNDQQRLIRIQRMGSRSSFLIWSPLSEITSLRWEWMCLERHHACLLLLYVHAC